MKTLMELRQYMVANTHHVTPEVRKKANQVGVLEYHEDSMYERYAPTREDIANKED